MSDIDTSAALDYGFDAATIVVDRPHWRLVAKVLATTLDPAVTAQCLAENETLDLALIRLDGVDAYAHGKTRPLDGTQIGRCPPDQAHPAADAAEPTPPIEETALDCVIRAVRETMAAKYGGWIPAIGKNRYMQNVMPFPQSKPLAIDLPKWTERPQDWIDRASSAGAGVHVGVLDTRIFAHPSLDGHFDADADSTLTITTHPLKGWQGHATFVVGLIAHEAPRAQITVRALFDRPHGGPTPVVPTADAWDTAVAIAGFAELGVHVLNLSLGCRTWDGEPPLAMRRAIEKLGPGTLVVAAAGNHGQASYWCKPTWPAALSGVVAVGARDAQFSPDLPWVTAEADGKDVTSTYLKDSVVEDEPPNRYGDGYAKWSGTSFAAATVTGAIAAAMTPKRPARKALHDLMATGKVVSAYKRSS
jgi:subtilisin family serine protease